MRWPKILYFDLKENDTGSKPEIWSSIQATKHIFLFRSIFLYCHFTVINSPVKGQKWTFFIFSSKSHVGGLSKIAISPL